MFVDKMQFAVPMATGYEGLPLTAAQDEKEEAEAFTIQEGCGCKRKAEEDREEEAAFTVKAKAEEEAAFTIQAKAEEVEDSDYDCDSDEEEEFMARLIADYNAHVDKLRADHPGMKYEDYSTEKYAYMRRKPEEVEDDDYDKFEKLRAEYAYFFLSCCILY
ncbi:hypothetical protein VPH35_032340 [Triticum aestivum]